MNFSLPPSTPIVRSEQNASADEKRSRLRKYGAISPSTGERASRAPLRPSVSERTARFTEKPIWPNSSWSNFTRSSSRAASISGNTYSWQRIAPWPKIIRLRVRMLAPSTVIATGAAL